MIDVHINYSSIHSRNRESLFLTAYLWGKYKMPSDIQVLLE